MSQSDERQQSSSKNVFYNENRPTCYAEDFGESSSPIDQVRQTRSKKMKFQILGMTENEADTQFLYQVKIGDKVGWVRKDFFIPKRLFALLQFYEQNVFFRQKEYKQME